jgi:hypothetical protein
MNLPDLIGPVEKSQPETNARRAIVWGQDNLLARAVSSFLKDTIWEVFSIANDGNIETLIQEIKRLNPEVVFLCRYRVEEEDSVLPLRLIEQHPCLKVITLGLDSNLMQVYSKQKIILQGAADLLSILENGNPNCTQEQEEVSAKKQNL